MDAQNENEIASKEVRKCGFIHWRKRTCNWTFIVFSFWNKFLKDKGFAPTEEPFKKLINWNDFGTSAFVYIS
jgi:leucyl-tRNA synthetase